MVTTLQLISALPRASYSICMFDSCDSASVSPTAVQSGAVVRPVRHVRLSLRIYPVVRIRLCHAIVRYSFTRLRQTD